MNKNQNNYLKALRNAKTFACAVVALCLSVVVAQAQSVTQTIYVDFGANAASTSRGAVTNGADTYGHYWTNITDSGTDKYLYPGTSFNVVNAAGNATDFTIVANSLISCNGMSGGGGLLSPSSDLIGDLAVATATEDYLFTEGHQNYLYFTFKGLDKNKAYRFYTFGSRTSTDTRTVTYRFHGETLWEGTLTTGGSGIGNGGYNGNNDKIVTSDPVFPDANGNITITMIKVSGSYVPINAMKIEELSGLTRPNTELSLKQKMLIDFGENNSDTRGHQTTGADTNGNYWNNIYCTSGNDIPSGTDYALVNTANMATGFTFTTGEKLKTNGLNNGGLASPDASFLGDLAIQTATEDYAFIETAGNSSTMVVSGLNKANCYKFSFFGSRSTTTNRNTTLTLSGQDSWISMTATSGTNTGGKGYNGNAHGMPVSDYIYPDVNGKITFTMTATTSMAHLSAIKIEEYTGGTRPEDAFNFQSVVLTGTASEGGNDVAFHEITPAATPTSRYETYAQLQPGSYTIKGTTDEGLDVVYGAGSEAGTLGINGAAFTVSESQVVRVVADLKQNTVEVTPVTVSLKGTVVPDGTTLAYAGNGVWSSTVTLDKASSALFADRSFYFLLNNNEQLALKQLTADHSKVAMGNEGYAVENIRLNGGTYTIVLDLRQGTFALNAETDDNRISVFGSSVSNGQGASSNHGYAYMYNQSLADRYADGASDNAFYISSVAINGNNTVNLLNRYEDLTRDHGKYVIFGLSLGNEGIHGAGNQQAIYDQFATNMQTLIAKARAEGRIPVVMNNYTRGDFEASDYEYVKRMNLLINEWDVPSVNLLGAIDNGSGKWAAGFQNGTDIYHPTTAGHREFYYAMVPSLFDAIKAGKGIPTRDQSKAMTISGKQMLKINTDEVAHPFTVNVRVKGNGAGRLMVAGTTSAAGMVSIDAEGKVVYTAAAGETVTGQAIDTDWHSITLSHYEAQQRTLLFVDNAFAGEVSESLPVEQVLVGDGTSDVSRQVSELFFWRSALNAEEVAAHNSGKMIQSSLDVYAATSDESIANIENRAQSLNTVVYEAPAATDIVPGDTRTPFAPAFDGVLMTKDSNGYYIYRGQLTQNQSYVVSGADEMNSDEWYVNRDFFKRQSDGSLKFLAVSGRYEVRANFNKQYFNVFPINSDDTPASLKDDGSGAVWAIGYVGKPVHHNDDGESWWTDVEHAVAMSQVSPKVYQLTVTVGQEVKYDYVALKFFGQAGWGTEFNPTGGKNITMTNPEKFFMKDSGDINIASGETLTDGETYRFTLDLNDPDMAYVNVSIPTDDEDIPTSFAISCATVNETDYFSTFYTSLANVLLPDGFAAYVGTVDGDNLKLTQLDGNIIPAGCAVVLKGNADQTTLYVTTDESSSQALNDAAANDLLGNDEDTPCEASSVYVLGKKNDVIQFYTFSGTTLSANKAYVPKSAVTVDANSLAFDFGDGMVDAIEKIGMPCKDNEEPMVYNLQGQRVQNPVKGIYIVNGRKKVCK